MKWAVLGEQFEKKRYLFLSQWLAESGFQNEVQFLNSDADKLKEFIEDSKSSFEQLRIETPYCERVIEESESVISLSLSLSAADCLVCDNQKWWPRNALYEAVVRLVAQRLEGLSLNSSVFVVGAGASAKSVIAALVKMGFISINITDRLTERGLELISELKRVYFNVEFEFTPADGLTLLPGHHQMIINTTPSVAENTLIEELCYFNYLQEGGVVVDLTLSREETKLLQEAKSVHAVTIDGCEMASLVDQVWFELCGAELASKKSFKGYGPALREFLLQHQD